MWRRAFRSEREHDRYDEIGDRDSSCGWGRRSSLYVEFHKFEAPQKVQNHLLQGKSRITPGVSRKTFQKTLGTIL
jgi:hypothetical protein